MWTDPVSGGQACQSDQSEQWFFTVILGAQRFPLKPIIYLQMLTYSQFVFVFVLRVWDRHHRTSSFGLRAKISKVTNKRCVTAITVTQRKQSGRRRVRCAHGEKTQCSPALRSDRRHPPGHKSDTAKRQDAQKDVRGASQSCRVPGCQERETCRECVSRCSSAHRGKRER